MNYIRFYDLHIDVWAIMAACKPAYNNDMEKEVLSTFKEMPKTRLGRWAFGLSLVTIFSGPFLGIFAAILSPFLTKTLNETTAIIVGFCVMAAIIALFFATLICSIKAFRHGERSWAVWLALVLSIIQSCFWAFMLIGELIFPH